MQLQGNRFNFQSLPQPQKCSVSLFDALLFSSMTSGSSSLANLCEPSPVRSTRFLTMSAGTVFKSVARPWMEFVWLVSIICVWGQAHEKSIRYLFFMITMPGILRVITCYVNATLGSELITMYCRSNVQQSSHLAQFHTFANSYYQQGQGKRRKNLTQPSWNIQEKCRWVKPIKRSFWCAVIPSCWRWIMK